MANKLKLQRVGVAVTGSFCTFDTALECIRVLIHEGAEVTTILSAAACTMDTKFGKAADFAEKLTALTGRPPITTIVDTEPIGPGKLLDAMLILPATGNTIAKLAAGIADSTTTFAAKSHLRNGRPLLLAISSNDALAAGAKNIGQLLNTKNIYFVPFGQDSPATKPRSIVFKKEYVLAALVEALEGRQLQPLLA
ncbi:MAG: dipicolinate synthase subunit B [Defluviitaleaceae bacterium]|nr:dipicolinate synthase subunit B [Defluviitaleaceae bacterium]